MVKHLTVPSKRESQMGSDATIEIASDIHGKLWVFMIKMKTGILMIVINMFYSASLKNHSGTFCKHFLSSNSDLCWWLMFIQPLKTQNLNHVVFVPRNCNTNEAYGQCHLTATLVVRWSAIASEQGDSAGRVAINARGVFIGWSRKLFWVDKGSGCHQPLCCGFRTNKLCPCVVRIQTLRSDAPLFSMFFLENKNAFWVSGST